MESLGLIEVVGYLGAIVASDVCLKAADISLSTVSKVGGGIVTVSITGEVGAVKAAVDVAKIEINKIGTLRAVHVIPRVSNELIDVLYRQDKVFEKLNVDNKKTCKSDDKQIEVIEAIELDTEKDLEEELNCTDQDDDKQNKIDVDKNYISVNQIDSGKKEIENKDIKVETNLNSEIDSSKNESELKKFDISKKNVKEIRLLIKKLDPTISNNTLKKMRKDELIMYFDKLEREES